MLNELKELKCPMIDEWIMKIWYLHTMEFYAALRKKEILSHTITWMKLKDIMLSEIRQLQKNKYYITFI